VAHRLTVCTASHGGRRVFASGHAYRLLLMGTVGAGTTTADAVGLHLEAASVPHAIIDLDEIRRMWPRPASDPFGSEIELRNVKPLAANYVEAGAERLVLAGVCESWADRRRYETAVAMPLVACRLHAPPDVLASRLRDRHREEPAELAWHLDRALELNAILDAARVADAMSPAARTRPWTLPPRSSGSPVRTYDAPLLNRQASRHRGPSERGFSKREEHAPRARPHGVNLDESEQDPLAPDDTRSSINQSILLPLATPRAARSALL